MKSKMRKNQIPVLEGSGNVFADLGLADAEDLRFKAELARQICNRLKKLRLTQVQAATRLGLKQPDVSKLVNGRGGETAAFRTWVPRSAFYPPFPGVEMLRADEPFRIVGQHHAFIPGTSALYELEDVRGYEALTLRRYESTYGLWCEGQAIWFNRVDDLTRPFLSFLNVRYAITTNDPPPGWHVVASQRGARLLENERVLPRAFIPNRLRIGRSGPIDATYAEVQDATDFADRAWVDAPMSLQDRANGPGSVSIERRRSGFRFRVSIANAGWVVVSEPAWNGWRAYVDGRRVQIQIANLAFLGIYVPAGQHTIRLIYLPESFVIGRAISFATLTALILFALLKRFQPFLERRNRGVASLPDGE